MPYKATYQTVKACEGNYSRLLPESLADLRATPQSADDLRELCEMILVREYDDWYVGAPAKNISQAIHRHCAALLDSKNRPTRALNRVAALLAWCYVELDQDTADAFLLLERVCESFPSRNPDKFLPAAIRRHLDEALSEWREDRGLPASLAALNDYELAVWREILKWEYHPETVFTPFSDAWQAAQDRVLEAVPDSIVTAIADALRGALTMLQDGSERLVREQALCAELRDLGFPVQKLEDAADVPLEVLDRIAKSSAQGGKITAGLNGAGCGAGGLIFMAADIPILIGLNLRFIQQIGATYGFRADEPSEREFVLNLLGYSAASQSARVGFMRELNRIAVAQAKRATWKQLEQQGLVRLIKRVSTELGVRLTHKKLGQLVPVMGSAVGAGVNYAFTHDNLVAALMMYRKRYLLNKCLAEPRALA